MKLTRVGVFGCTPGPAERLSDVDRGIAAAEHEPAGARERIAALLADPTLLDQPADRLIAERNAWRARDADRSRFPAALRPAAVNPGVPRPESERRGPSLTRGGASPGLGR